MFVGNYDLIHILELVKDAETIASDQRLRFIIILNIQVRQLMYTLNLLDVSLRNFPVLTSLRIRQRTRYMMCSL